MGGIVMGKFNTTNLNLFNKNNKEVIPQWMENIVDGIDFKEKEVQELDVEKRGVFAEKVQVYRPELTADPRYLQQYGDSRAELDAKITLSKVLSGKHYKVVESNSSGGFVSLSVQIDNVAANFNFPFEVNGMKLEKSATFYANDSEYPFSKAGLNECLSDIKSGIVKKSSISKSIDKTYVINREEIIRRYNGSLRKATDKINDLLKSGTIVGVGSNSYGTVFNIEELFPQEEKEAPQERLAEFHFAPNQEHVETNEYKTENYLKIEASKILRNHFKDFSIENSKRNENKLLVDATVLDNFGVRTQASIEFPIEGEKLSSFAVVKYDEKFSTLEKMASNLNSNKNKAIDEFSKKNNVEKRMNEKYILTKKDIESKLFKIINQSSVNSVIDGWITNGQISPINSKSYATNKTFTELLSNIDTDVLSDEEIQKISLSQKHFGNDIEVETDIIKPNYKTKDIGEIESSNEARLFNANSYISRHLKNYKLASYVVKNNDTYQLNIDLINKKTGTRHSIPVDVSFENAKVLSCTANVSGKVVSLEKLLNAFSSNKVLSFYLQDKVGNLSAGPIVVTEAGLRNKLSKIITSSKIDSVLDNWIERGRVDRLDEEHLASQYSLQELLSELDDEHLITDKELDDMQYQQNHFGKQIKVKTDDKMNDTGVRQAEDVWSTERKETSCYDKISKLFKESKILYTEESDKEDKIVVHSNVRNPMSGDKLNLSFTFNLLDGGKVGEILEVSDQDEVVSVDKLTNILEKHTSKEVMEYTKHNKVSKFSHNSLINDKNLQNKLQSVAKKENIPSIIKKLVNDGVLNPINSTTYASNLTTSEIVSISSSSLDVDGAKEEASMSKRSEHKFHIDEKRVEDSDTREIKKTTREIDEKLSKVKERLVVATYQAANKRKITANKCGDILQKLENSKTVKDLEKVSKELESYFEK